MFLVFLNTMIENQSDHRKGNDYLKIYLILSEPLKALNVSIDVGTCSFSTVLGRFTTPDVVRHPQKDSRATLVRTGAF